MKAVRRNNRRFLMGVFFFSFAATLGFLGVMNQPNTEAASTSGFKAGNIISDYVMKDYNSMTESQIQSFLKSKVSCNQDSSLAATGAYKFENVNTKANGVSYNRRYYWKKSNGGDTSALYHVGSNGKFVCLADESFDGVSAAHIIWDAAQYYKINPKVLIVLLQKEQGLITDSWPNEIQYRAATGYGCPDTAACDAKYYGFYNQVGNAAYLFNAIMYNGKHNLYPVGNNYVRYNPNAACGGSTVKIENSATGALYTYTPYQPNAGSLAAGYGTTTDGCGAYGNRNFYLYYSDWFGDTHEAEKNSGVISQSNEAIQSRWNAIGGGNGKLKNSIGKVKCGLINSGCYQSFNVGIIIWTEKTGAWDISGAILEHWVKEGSEWGSLGYPTSGEKIDEKKQTYQEFEKGRVYWTKEKGAWTVKE